MRMLLDAGPLVALLDRRDEHHAWAAEQAGQLALPFRTCEAVLSETYFRLAHVHDGRRQLSRLIQPKRLDASFSFEAHRERVLELMERYENVPMSFADACLVCMAELDENACVFTTDRDFLIYRKHRSERIPVLLP